MGLTRKFGLGVHDRVQLGTNLNYSVPFLISGSASEQTDIVLPIYIHKGFQNGEITTQDVFMNNKCKSDFSDVYFEDLNGNKLDHYLASHGNYEIIKKSSGGGAYSIILPDGSIITTYITEATKLYKSVDNGLNWNIIYSSSDIIQSIHFDSRGYIFITKGNKLYKSIDGGMSFSQVYDFSAVSGYLLTSTFSENINGDLYIGRYQSSNSVLILKSIDGGDTWTSVYAETTHQHVHGLKCDPYTGYIYAGLDGTTFSIIRSVDNGENWVEIANNIGNPVSIFCGNGYRLFGNEANRSNSSILRTTDDITFIPVLQTAQHISFIRNIGSKIFAQADTFNRNKYPTIYKSEDDGLTWTAIKVGKFNLTNFFGHYLFHSNVGSPVNQPEQIMLGKSHSFSLALIQPERLIGSGYEAMFYVKIPALPTTGLTINVKSGKQIMSTLDTFVEPTISNLLLHYPLNESSGNTILDTSGNTKHGVLTIGSGSWNFYKLRRVGSSYPFLTKQGSSIKLNSDGYITVTNSGSDVDLQLIKNFSLIIWASTSNLATMNLIDCINGNYGWKFHVGDSYDLLEFSVGNGTIVTKYNSAATDISAQVQDGKPYMLGLVVDNSTPAKLKFICNGALSTTNYQMSSDAVLNGTNLKIGNGWKGDIDDVRIYNKPLSDIEVRKIYEFHNGERT